MIFVEFAELAGEPEKPEMEPTTGRDSTTDIPDVPVESQNSSDEE